MKKTIIIIFSCMISISVMAQWQRSITNYSRHIYKAANQNWMVAQHENGWMYFANNSGLLEFDGVTWNTYSIHNAKTRALKPGKDGRIYVGGLGQFGYFAPNRLGGLDYICLSDSLELKRNAGNVWNIHIIEDRVYFQTDHAIYYFENEKLEVARFDEGILYSGVVNNKLYLCGGEGVYFLNGNQFTHIPNTTQCVQSKPIGVFPYKDQIMFVTSLHGIYLYDGAKVSRYESDADSFFESNQLLCSAQKDSLLALGSVQNGVLLLNLESGETEKISTNNGLQNKTVLSMLFDRENNLWLGLDNGIDCINLNAPLYFLYSRMSAIGSGYSSCIYNGKIYLGTNQGMYSTEYPIQLNEGAGPEIVPDTEGQIWTILKYDNKLFSGGANALMVYDGINARRIRGIRGVWTILPLKQYPNYLVAGTYTGLFLLKKENDEWKVLQRIEKATNPAKCMYIEDITNAVWTANKEKGLFRTKLSKDLLSGEEKKYNSQELPAGDNVHINKINDEIVIATRRGLFKYNQVKDTLERNYQLEEMLDGNVSYSYIMQDEYKNIWYVTNNMLRVARYQAETNNWIKSESESYLHESLIEDFEHIQIVDKQNALIGTEEGFCLLQFNKNIAKKHPLNLEIRKVYLTMGRDSLIYGRNYSYSNERVLIPYSHKSLKIEYSVNNYDKSIATMYAYRLEGSDYSEWSDYSENNIKEYTNLQEGKYSFQIKLITNSDKTPISNSFEFEILPPWYRTWYAYLLYIAVSIMIISYAYYYLNKRQERIIKKKNLEIIHQKNELKKVSALKDQEIDSLEERNLQSELKHKSDELVKTTMNIVRKNEMLQAIRKEAVAMSRSIEEENLPSIRRKIIRLIGQIDTNMEHDDDLNAFQTSFDSLHHGFFEKLDQEFPGLNKKEKLLCAYIKMDLMSKEIAPLMNITLRGVEISRYRLRKKLNLSTEDNLAEFLQRL